MTPRERLLRTNPFFTLEEVRAHEAAAAAAAMQDLLVNVEYLMEEHGTRLIDIEDLRAVVAHGSGDGATTILGKQHLP